MSSHVKEKIRHFVDCGNFAACHQNFTRNEHIHSRFEVKKSGKTEESGTEILERVAEIQDGGRGGGRIQVFP